MDTFLSQDSGYSLLQPQQATSKRLVLDGWLQGFTLLSFFLSQNWLQKTRNKNGEQINQIRCHCRGCFGSLGTISFEEKGSVFSPIRVFQRLFRWPCLIPKTGSTANGGSSWNSLGSQDDILEDTKCSKGGLFEQFGRISTFVGSVVTGDGR